MTAQLSLWSGQSNLSGNISAVDQGHHISNKKINNLLLNVLPVMVKAIEKLIDF